MAWYDGEKAREFGPVQAYIDDLDEPQRSICQAVRERVKQDPAVVEGIAWGVPFYFRHGPLCYTSAARRHVTVGFARGMEIDDPTGQLRGTGKSPIAKAVVKKDLPAEFEDWLQQAFALDEVGD